MKRICVPEKGDIVVDAKAEILFKVREVDFINFAVRCETHSGSALRNYAVDELCWSGTIGLFYLKRQKEKNGTPVS